MNRWILPLLLVLPLSAQADPVKVAVYTGPGTDEQDAARLQQVLGEQQGVEVGTVGAEDLASGLANVDVLVVGGGSGTRLAKGLDATSARALEQFVRKGGGYVGTGAGAYLAAQGYNASTHILELVDARVVSPKQWKRGTGTVTLTPVLGSLPSTWQFQNGPLFAPAQAHGLPAYEVWARFETGVGGRTTGAMPGKDAIVRAPCGKGRVVLFSVLAHQRAETVPGLVSAIRWASRGGETAPAPVAPAGLVRVAVLDDQGCIDSCVVSAFACLPKTRFWVRRVSGRDVSQGALSFYDAVILPGGSATKQSRALSPEGRKRLKAFVARGGGYVGICAGAYLAASEPKRYGLGLAAVKVVDTKHWRRGSGIVVLEATNDLVRITGREGSKLSMVYANGPLLEELEAEGLPKVTPLARFVSDMHKNGAPKGMMPGKLACLATDYLKGRLVLFSTHPELTPGLGDMLTRSVLWSVRRKAVKH